MKLLLHIGLAAVLLLIKPASVRAQAVPNGGFETWAPRDEVDSPADWLTLDDLLSVFPFWQPLLPSGTYTKTTDAHSGSYALRLESKASSRGVLVGAAELGSSQAIDLVTSDGLPFTGRPAMLQIYYKLTGPQSPVPEEAAGVSVELTRTVNGEVESLAYGYQTFSVVTDTYVLAQVPLVYTSTATPDSVHILCATNGDSDVVGDGVAGTVFQVDDLTFSGVATATRRPVGVALNVFPNPSADGHYLLSAGAEPDLLRAALTVLDATGRVVYHENAASLAATGTRTLDLSRLPAGIYSLQLVTRYGLMTCKLMH